MTTASVLIAALVGSGAATARRRLERACAAAATAGADEIVVVVSTPDLAGGAPGSATVLLDEGEPTSATGALRVAADWCARIGHEALLAGLVASEASPYAAVLEPRAWERMAHASRAPIVLAETAGRFAGLVRLDVMAWPLLPLEGSLEGGLRAHGGLVEVVELAPSASLPEAGGDPARPSDREAVEALLGRPPKGPFRVVVRDRTGAPVVIENAPFLDDGTPMPTTYWLVGATERAAVSRLEAAGGVRRAEAAVPADAVAAAHARYATERDERIADDHHGPRPSGGVGGTRTGVKCLHAHLAWYLAGGADPVGRFVAHELAGELDGPVAAIDCGTNSTRLLVCDRSGVRLARETRITRLGEGVDAHGELSGAAIERTIGALRDYRALMDRHGVVRFRCVATSAARDAANAAVLLEAVAAVLGAPAELLSGEEEGRLAYAGATAELDAHLGPFVVVDLGGGSTELVTRRAGAIELVSLPMGCVRIRERFLSGDPPTAAELTAGRSYVRSLLDAARAVHPAFSGAATMVGVAGTVSTLALLAAGVARYASGAAHHLRLSHTEVRELLALLGARTLAERAAMPGIEQGRADVLVGGALVLDEVMDVLGFDELVCSETDILDGLAASLVVRTGPS